MIDTEEVIAYFDRLAPEWDDRLVRDDGTIRTILDNAGVTEGKDVLDVACGTGVMIPYYLERGAASVTGIDISPEMSAIARKKFNRENVRILCGDAETAGAEGRYDCIVLYNAFPHFPEPRRLVAALAGRLRPGGMLTVAHGMSRERVNAHHSGSARHVSNGLMPAEQLASLFAQFLTVTAVVSDERMYQVTGRRRD